MPESGCVACCYQPRTQLSEFYRLLIPQLFDRILPRVLGVIFGLKNLRRAPGQSGVMSRCVMRFSQVLTEPE